VATVTGISRSGPRDHVVHFYHSEEELATQAGGYLAKAIRGGGVAIVIASEKHQFAFERRLAEAGIDVSAARASGAWLVVDAEEALSQFTVNGKPDAGGFDVVIGKLVRRAAGRGRPVRAYGEMVAMLWEAGLLTAAIELEKMWNELIRKEKLALLCAYPAGSVAGELHSTAFTEVCRLHAAIVEEAPDAGLDEGRLDGAGLAEQVWTFPAALESARAARHVMTAALEKGGSPHLADDAALVVTELATNAVVHARSGFRVTLTLRQDVIHISVHDDQPLPADSADTVADIVAVLPAAPLHGLGAVAALAARWGAYPAGIGKDVWAELSRW
jgi:anti-sigma regulatory factor (Ser/Thr protein kinase)